MVNRKTNTRRHNQTAQIASLRKEIRGHSFTPAADPSMVNDIPWNTLTVQFQAATAQSTIKVSDLQYNITNQLLLFGTTGGTEWRVPIEFRLLEVRVYALNSSVSLDLVVYDPTNPDNGTLASLRDKGTLNRPAKVGYQYPIFVSSNPLYGATENTRTVVNANVSSGLALYKFRVLWRPY